MAPPLMVWRGQEAINGVEESAVLGGVRSLFVLCSLPPPPPVTPPSLILPRFLSLLPPLW